MGQDVLISDTKDLHSGGAWFQGQAPANLHVIVILSAPLPIRSHHGRYSRIRSRLGSYSRDIAPGPTGGSSDVWIGSVGLGLGIGTIWSPHRRRPTQELVGGKKDDVEAFMAQVDWHEFAQLVGTPMNSSSGDTVSPLQLRDIKFEDIQMTPEQKEQIKRLQKKRKDGKVDCQVIQYERGQPPRPEDDDDEQLVAQWDKLRTEEEQDEQATHEGVRASKDFGKRAVWPEGGVQQDGSEGYIIAWEPQGKTARLELIIRTNDAKINTLETEMRRMKKEFEEKSTTIALRTPLRQNIATFVNPRRHGNDKDGHRQNTVIILAGVIQRQPRSPDTNSFSDSSDTRFSVNELYRVANGGGGSGDGDGGSGDDGHGEIMSMGGDTFSRNGRGHEFMLVKASNITVTTFTGIH